MSAWSEDRDYVVRSLLSAAEFAEESAHNDREQAARSLVRAQDADMVAQGKRKLAESIAAMPEPTPRPPEPMPGQLDGVVEAGWAG